MVFKKKKEDYFKSTMYVSPADWKKLKTLAKKENTTIAEMVRYLIREYVNAN